MKILFITATRLGDAVLSTGALDELIRRYPGAEITVACGPLVAGLFASAPGVKKVIALKKGPFAGHWVKLARETLGEKWDVVILDPPKFIFTRDAAGNWEGRQKYEDLNLLSISLVKPGGIFVTCSCSGLLSLEDFESHVIKAAHRLNRRLQFFDRTGPGPDHPVFSNCLESRYLKVLWARVV